MGTAALQLDYVPADELAAKTASWWNNVLGVVGFASPPRSPLEPIPVTASMTRSLGASGGLCEVWRVAGNHALELSSGALPQGRARYRYCRELLFGTITIDEDGFDGNAAAALLRATETAYREIFAVLKTTQHRHLIRIWNYLPQINADADGDERYRRFNCARQAAFRESGRAAGMLPAASALGSPAGSPISIYFLASRESPRAIENPRQTSAYFYPPKFGAHRPLFSRACVLRGSGGTNLFVSGTASIVGHETLHHGDVAAQTRESMVNIHALLDEANRVVGSEQYSLERLKFKVYVRQPSDLEVIERVLAARLQGSTCIVYLQADVCREDLLVEIEAAGEPRSVNGA